MHTRDNLSINLTCQNGGFLLSSGFKDYQKFCGAKNTPYALCPVQHSAKKNKIRWLIASPHRAHIVKTI